MRTAGIGIIIRTNPPSPAPSPSSLRDDAVATLRLAVPIIAGQLSQMLLGVADTAMIGRVGTTPLAAAAFVTNLFHIPFVFGMGLLTAVSIRVSQAKGSDQAPRARTVLRHGLWLALGMGIGSGFLALGLWPCLGSFGQDAPVVAASGPYLLLVFASLFPAFLGLAIKNHADALNHPWPPFWITFAAVLLNVFLNWILIYGNLGSPALGLEGAGIATLLARWAAFAGILAWAARAPSLRGWVPRRWIRLPDTRELASLARLGLPSAIQLLAEVSAFVAAGLLIGTLGEAALAAHQVALVCAATIFMVPLGLSMAVTVRVGTAMGAGEPGRVRLILKGALALAGIFTVASLSGILAGRNTIAGWFVTDPGTARAAAGLLLISAIFQTGDAIQVISAGALRGLEDVRFPARAAFAAHWLVGLPVAWILAFPLGMGVNGVWWGLTIGLTGCAALFLGRFRLLSAGLSRPLPR